MKQMNANLLNVGQISKTKRCTERPTQPQNKYSATDDLDRSKSMKTPVEIKPYPCCWRPSVSKDNWLCVHGVSVRVAAAPAVTVESDP